MTRRDFIGLATVDVRVIPHARQRYETVGDYVMDGERLVIRVSKMQDPRHEFLIAFHELVEATLLRHRKISFRSVDEFDIAFEISREPGNVDEPGDDIGAPYYKEHQFASMIEKLMAIELGVDWRVYTEACNDIGQPKCRRR